MIVRYSTGAQVWGVDLRIYDLSQLARNELDAVTVLAFNDNLWLAGFALTVNTEFTGAFFRRIG